MILDVNAFIGRWPFWPIPATTGAEVARTLDAAGIDRAAIVSTRGVFVHCGDGNREVACACREHPARFVPFACVGTRELSHLDEPPAEAARAGRPRTFDLDACVRDGFRGLRLYPQHHSYQPLYADFIEPLLEDAAARRLPVLLPLRIIMNWGMPMLELPVIEALVTRHPRVVWILAGINYLWELQLAAMLMARNPNVHLETSCVMGFDALAKLVAARGAGQLLFGSGAPIQHAAAGLEKVVRAKISAADRDAILGRNAQRLFDLE